MDDGVIYQVKSVSQDELNACDSGAFDIINPTDMTRYYDGRWVEIETFNM